MNPNHEDASATVQFRLPGGETSSRSFTVPARRKLSVSVDDIMPDTPVSARVTTSLPTVVERTMFKTTSEGIGVTNAVGIPR